LGAIGVALFEVALYFNEYVKNKAKGKLTD
jgi:hypothetical protein